MRKIILLTLVITAGQILFAQTPIFTKANLNSVNVYKNSAELQNTAIVSIPAGFSELVIGNIAETIEEKSLQIGINDPNTTILSSQFTTDYTSNFKIDLTNPHLKKISDSIKVVENKINQNTIEIEANTKTIELLDNNQTIFSGSNSSNIAQLTQLTEYYTNKLIEINKKITKLNQNNEDLEKTLVLLKKNLKTNEEKEVDEIGRGVLVLKLMSKTASKITLNIDYLASKATWTPYYEIKGNNITDPLTLQLKAIVKQKTGLNWKSVKLSLIDGISSINNTAPVIEPWFLRTRSQDENVYRKRENYQLLNSKAAPSAMSTDDAEIEEFANFEVNSNQLNTSYNIDIPYDILTNNKDHFISLYQQEIPAEYVYYTVPNYNNSAFLVAKIKEFSKYDLISAPAKIVFENMYIGETYLNTNQIDDNLNITLGNDKRISVKRENIKDKSTDKFLSTNREKTITYDIVIRNNKKETIDIEIKDRIPISTNESIKIELLEHSSATMEEEKGFLQWNIKISQNETKKIRVSYKIRFPKNLIITNL